jgi:hypothetical protein
LNRKDVSLHPITLYSEGNAIPSFNTLVSSFNAEEAWIAQIDMMKRSSTLSKCGQYLVLSATLGAERFQMIVDLPNKEESTSKERASGSTGQAIPKSHRAEKDILASAPLLDVRVSPTHYSASFSPQRHKQKHIFVVELPRPVKCVACSSC